MFQRIVKHYTARPNTFSYKRYFLPNHVVTKHVIEMRLTSTGSRKKYFDDEGSEALGQVAQGSRGCLIRGSVQSQVGQSFKQPDLVKDIPPHRRGGWTRWSLKIPANSYPSIVL